MKPLLRNSARCRLCNSIIESKHVHDFVVCSCWDQDKKTGIAIDGGLEYQRCLFFSEEDFENLAELNPLYKEPDSLIIISKERKPMRQRVEDLGKIAVKLDKCLDSKIFELPEWHQGLDLTNFPSFDDELGEFCAKLEELREEILECYEIAEGEDPQNRRSDSTS